MDAYTDGELDTFGLLQPGIQVSHRSEDTQPRTYGSLGIIFMGLGIAKIHEETIPKELRNVSIIAVDDFGTHPFDTHGPRPGSLRGRAAMRVW